MKKPVLVIMAAGMGSRYGGLKQIDPVDKEGHIIMDFSIFDAKRAGFEKVVFIIKKEDEADFKEAVGNRMEKIMDVAYAYQDLHNLPEGFEVPEGRVKPWGTAHAVLSAIDEVDGPFAVINADDYYGRHIYNSRILLVGVEVHWLHHSPVEVGLAVISLDGTAAVLRHVVSLPRVLCCEVSGTLAVLGVHDGYLARHGRSRVVVIDKLTVLA